MEADRTPFTGEKVDADFPIAVFDQGVKPARREAKSAAGAFLHVNSGFLAALENVPFLDFRMKKKVEVGGIHVDVGQDGVPGKSRKAGRYDGLAGAAFPADDDDLFHDPIFPILSNSARNFSW
jgi:hypothetical protein